MSRQKVRQVDVWAIEEMGLAGVVLMENAGRSCAEFILGNYGGGIRASVFCGTGNNGGDGYVIARHLTNAGCKVQVIICGDREKITGDAAINLKVIKKMGVNVVRFDAGSLALAGRADVIVDAIFGTGLAGNVKAQYADIIDGINGLGREIVAVDIPSGLDCDTGEPLGTAIKAVATITFVAAKYGFKNPASQAYTGQVYIASIGIEPR